MEVKLVLEVVIERRRKKREKEKRERKNRCESKKCSKENSFLTVTAIKKK